MKRIEEIYEQFMHLGHLVGTYHGIICWQKNTKKKVDVFTNIEMGISNK